MGRWEKINQNLGGQNGIVYLMFLGRETTGEDVAKELETNIANKILKEPDSQVYTAIKSLENDNYINFVKKDGRRKIRTARIDPIFETYAHFNNSSDYFTEEVVRTIGKFMCDFPKYASRILQAKTISIRGKEWSFLFLDLYKPFVEMLATLAFIDRMKALSFPELGFSGGFLKKYLEAFIKGGRSLRRKDVYLNAANECLTRILERMSIEDKTLLAKYMWSCIGPLALEVLPVRSEEKEEFFNWVSEKLGEKSKP